MLAASTDAGLDGPPVADAVRVVGQLSWRYGNAPRFLADRLGLTPRHLDYTTMGGNSPQSLVNATAIEIQAGEIDIAVLAGGEATRTRHRARTAGIELDWPKADPGDEPRIVGDDLQMNLEAETDARHLACRCRSTRCSRPRSERRRAVPSTSIASHLGRLWSALSQVAARNPYAWIREARTAGRDHDRHRRQPDDRAAVPETDELEQPGRHGRRADHVLGRSRPPPRCRRGSVGVRPRRHRLPRAQLHLAPRDVRPDAGHRDRWPPGARARRDRHRRRLDHRPLLVLPGRRAARGAVARHRPATASGHAPVG